MRRKAPIALAPAGEELAADRHLLVSARAPRPRETVPPAGGVAGAVAALAELLGGRWIAWDGDGDGAPPDPTPGDGRPAPRLLSLPPRDAAGFYLGFANQMLWPLCHGLPERCRLSAEHWLAYERTNRRFAAAILEERLSPRHVVWVHDYQLALLPHRLRAAATGARIAFFWHVPFPAWEHLRLVPWRRELVQGLLGSDLVACHRRRDVDNFLDAAERLRPRSVDRAGRAVLVDGRRVRVRAIPLGVDADRFERLARSPAVRARAAAIRAGRRAERLVLSVERLDYTKGIVERLRAIEMLFVSRPELKGRVHFIQRGAPSREQIPAYGELRRAIEGEVDRVNRRIGTADWQPISLEIGLLPQRELVPYYLAADLALVTPLRDGMNLVAKEYVASKPEPAAGALVLSRFAGVAEELGGDALVVNPFNPMEVAHATLLALTMTAAERGRRLRRLRERVRRRDVGWWARRLAAELAAGGTDAAAGGAA
jgi:trehalose 6-phosphate synthase